MISREHLPLWIGSGSPASLERAALVVGDAPGLANRVRTTPCICNCSSKARACSWLAGGGPICVGVSPSAKLIGNLPLQIR